MEGYSFQMWFVDEVI